MEVQLNSSYKDNDTEKQYTLQEIKMLKCYIPTMTSTSLFHVYIVGEKHI